MFRADPGLVTNILSSHIHEGVSRHLPEPDVDLISEDARTLPCHASVLAAASPLLARILRRPVIQDGVVTNYSNYSNIITYIALFIIQTEELRFVITRILGGGGQGQDRLWRRQAQ